MSQTPGQSTVPFEEFIAAARHSLGDADLHFTAKKISEHQFRVHSGMGDQDFSSQAEAHAYMEEQRKFWGEKAGNFYRIVEIPHEGAPAPAKPVIKPAHSSAHLKKHESHAENRALQQSPPKTGTPKAGPPPVKSNEPGPAKRTVATEPLKPAAKPQASGDSRPADTSPAQRAKAAFPKSPAERPLALASDAGVEQFLADAIGSGPAMVGMLGVTTLNPFLVYEASKLSDWTHPLQQRLAEDAEERYHRAEGTASSSLLAGVTFAGMVLPQMVGGPEEEASLAEATVVRMSLGRLSRFAEAAETGELRSVVTDERLYSGLQAALSRSRKAKDVWSNFRSRAGKQLSELYQTALHHFKYPRSKYKKDVLNLEHLWVAPGKSHGLIHAAEGQPGMMEIPDKGFLPRYYKYMDPEVERAPKELQDMLRFWTSKEAPNIPSKSMNVPLSVQLQEESAWVEYTTQPGPPVSVQRQEAAAWAEFEEFMSWMDFWK